MTLLAAVVRDLTRNRGRGIRSRVRRALYAVLVRLRLRPPPTRTYSVAWGPRGDALLAALRSRLASSGVGYLEGAALRPTARRIHVALADLPALFDAVAHVAEEVPVLARVKGESRFDLTPRSAASIVERGKSFDLLIVEREAEGIVPHRQCSRLEVAVWSNTEAPRGEIVLESDLKHTKVARLRRQTFRELGQQRFDFDSDLAAPTQPAFDIDVV